MRYVALLLSLLITVQTASAQLPASRRIRRDSNRMKAIYLNDYRKALPRFDAAVKQLESTLGNEKARLSNPGKELEKQTDIFLRYLKFVNEEHPKFEPEELANYSNTELGWEALTAAESLMALLPKVPEGENSVVVNLNFWKFLYLLEGELLRLKWMTSRLK